MWKQWILALAGLVVIASPFLSLAAVTLSWTLVLAGIVIVGLSLWSALETSSETYTESRFAHR
ncbi:MAG: hypothetical protein V4436_03085 [Patescibacteria group bacterium]